LLRAETLIGQALRFDVSAVANRLARSAAQQSEFPWVTPAAGIAAGLLLAFTVWGLGGSGPPLTTEELAGAIVEHWYHEPDAWEQTELSVAAAELAQVLGGAAAIDLASLQTVSFAKACLVGGERIPHLVIQGEQGPYMVLLLPGRPLASAIPLALPSESLVGHILPAGGGSIAVLGIESAELEQVETSVASAINWTI
jgi:hypothetical protein